MVRSVKASSKKVARPEVHPLGWSAAYLDAKSKAVEKGGRLPTLIEFLTALEDPEQYKRLEGYTYWLGDGQAPEVSGWCKFDSKKRKLVKVMKREWYDLLPKERVFVCEGNGPLVLWGHNCDWKRGLCVEAANAYDSEEFMVAYVAEEHARPEAHVQLRA